MIITTERLRLETLDKRHALQLRDYHIENAAHLEAWEPARPKGTADTSYWKKRTAALAKQQKLGQRMSFLAFRHGEDKISAVCNFANIVRGAFQACHLGYSVAASEEGRGIMFETVEAGLAFVFGEMKLNRVMANYLPENTRSERVLNRLGFEREGYARSYLKINGRWRDHILTSKLNPNLIE